MLELYYNFRLIVPYQRILQCKRSSAQGIHRIQSIEGRDDVSTQKCEVKSEFQDTENAQQFEQGSVIPSRRRYRCITRLCVCHVQR